MSDASCNSVTTNDPAPEWVSHGGFVGLIFLVILMFWGMAFVCEEYSIPSITVFCKRNNIPDDIAGAIYIGTGLSLPVLFVSFIGLFVSNSAIGVGTVIGGDLFNHLINIGISIWVAPNHTLKINSLVVTREIICYALSSLLIIWAVHDNFLESIKTTFNKDQWLSCLNIGWIASLTLVLSYVGYVIVESYFDRLMGVFQKYFNACLFRLGFRGIYQAAAVNVPPTAANSSRDELEKDFYDIEGHRNNQIRLTVPDFINDDYPVSRSNSNATIKNDLEEGNTQNYSRSFPSPKDQPVRWKNNSSNPSARSSFSSSAGDKSSANSNSQLIAAEESQSNNNLFSLAAVQTQPNGQNNNDDLVEVNLYSITQQQLLQQNSLSLAPPKKNNLLAGTYGGYSQLNTDSPTFPSSVKDNNFISSANPLSTYKGLSSVPEHLGLNNFILYIRITHPFVDCLPFNYKWKKRFCILNDYGLYYKSTDDITLPSLAGKGNNSPTHEDDAQGETKAEYFTPQSNNAIKHVNLFKLQGYTVDSVDHLEFSVRLNDDSCTLMYFRAPNEYIFNLILHKLDWFAKFIKQHSELELSMYSSQAKTELFSGVSDEVPISEDGYDDYERIISDPDGKLATKHIFEIPTFFPLKMLYYFTLPLKYLLYATIPDVRVRKHHHRPILSTLIGFTWLAAFTYILVISLNFLAQYLSINPIIMGYTVATWSAAYPALWSSLVVARNNFGDIAVCNALGSNVFNNLIGLGLPWLVYSAVYRKSYSGVQDQGVAYSILLLLMLLAVFYVIIALNRFVLKYWMVPLFLLTYLGFTAYFIYFTITL